jgi:hypothetical protein
MDTVSGHRLPSFPLRGCEGTQEQQLAMKPVLVLNLRDESQRNQPGQREYSIRRRFPWDVTADGALDG